MRPIEPGFPRLHRDASCGAGTWATERTPLPARPTEPVRPDKLNSQLIGASKQPPCSRIIGVQSVRQGHEMASRLLGVNLRERNRVTASNNIYMEILKNTSRNIACPPASHPHVKARPYLQFPRISLRHDFSHHQFVAKGRIDRFPFSKGNAGCRAYRGQAKTSQRAGSLTGER